MSAFTSSATTHWFAQNALNKFGAESKGNKRIVKSGKFINAAGVSAGIDLSLSVVKDLCGQERAEVFQLVIEYEPQPPVDSGYPAKASKSVYKISIAEMLKA